MTLASMNTFFIAPFSFDFILDLISKDKRNPLHRFNNIITSVAPRYSKQVELF